MSTGFRCADDLMELAQPVLSQFDKRLKGMANDPCAAFYAEARMLDGQLLGIYRVAVLCARRARDLSDVAEIWSRFIRICDGALRRLEKLIAMHPDCGAAQFRDRILDLRNRCERLRQIHI